MILLLPDIRLDYIYRQVEYIASVEEATMNKLLKGCLDEILTDMGKLKNKIGAEEVRRKYIGLRELKLRQLFHFGNVTLNLFESLKAIGLEMFPQLDEFDTEVYNNSDLKYFRDLLMIISPVIDLTVCMATFKVSFQELVNQANEMVIILSY